MFKLSGVHLSHHKNTAALAPVRMEVPKKIVLPMSMHIGAPASPCVKVGDTVKVGQLVGEAGAGLSSPVYSSVSGKVVKLGELTAANGAHVNTVVIEPDGKQEIFEGVAPPTVTSHDEFISALKSSGIVGLGGAGFPTIVKLAADISRIDTIVVNGAECEPYITSDTRTMLDDAELVAEGIGLLQKYLEADRVVVGIENNKKQCIAKMKQATSDMSGVEVKALPALYPQGGEKVLVYHTVGRVIGEGKLPLDCGVIVINCTTVAAIAKYLRTGMPLVERCVTVDGSAIAEPKNVIAPIGTPIIDIIEFCGGFSAQPRKILMGGPMMGISVPDLNMPLVKQNNAILAFDRDGATPPAETACIKCGKCLDSCPFRLSPVDIAAAYEKGDGEALERLKVNLCMECGCCSYICPAKRNLVQTNKLAKVSLRSYQTMKKEAEKNG